jgi:hypothetical protein
MGVKGKRRKHRRAQSDIIINMKKTYVRIERGTGAVATVPPPRPSDSETLFRRNVKPL